jgi:hypothetical protein
MSNKNLSPLSVESPQYKKLMGDIVNLIQQGRRHVATEVNSTVVLLYWAIGKRINDEVLSDRRAEYGDHLNISPK